jgi:long-chain acyl-CoA synthetase
VTGFTLAHAGVAPVYRDDPRLRGLIGPGAPFEVENVILDGVPLRDFVRAPRTIVDVFRMGASRACASWACAPRPATSRPTS